jgi:hypothetical protein
LIYQCHPYYERDIRTVELTDWGRLQNLAQNVNKGDPRKVSQLDKIKRNDRTLNRHR